MGDHCIRDFNNVKGHYLRGLWTDGKTKLRGTRANLATYHNRRIKTMPMQKGQFICVYPLSAVDQRRWKMGMSTQFTNIILATKRAE